MNSINARPSPMAAPVWGLPRWFIPFLASLVIEVFVLIAVGGSVRMMNAGLACPDWPLCFGDVIPDYHPQVYFEFIHRVFAGLVALATAALAIALIFRSSAPLGLKRWMMAAVVLLLSQIIFGGLTVLWQLHSMVVATHLTLGLSFFGMLLALYLRIKEPHPPGTSPRLRGWSLFVAVVVLGQIILGGLVASHYASLVCMDFPTCHGEWFPTFSGIIGLHVIHRLGAYFTFSVILVNLIVVLRSKPSSRQKRMASGMFVLVCLQVAIGIANVLLATPPLIAVSHLATATLIWSVAIRQLHYSNFLAIRSR